MICVVYASIQYPDYLALIKKYKNLIRYTFSKSRYSGMEVGARREENLALNL